MAENEAEGGFDVDGGVPLDLAPENARDAKVRRDVTSQSPEMLLLFLDMRAALSPLVPAAYDDDAKADRTHEILIKFDMQSMSAGNSRRVQHD